MTITCLVIRKVTGNSTVTYDGRTHTPQAAPRIIRARSRQARAGFFQGKRGGTR